MRERVRRGEQTRETDATIAEKLRKKDFGIGTKRKIIGSWLKVVEDVTYECFQKNILQSVVKCYIFLSMMAFGHFGPQNIVYPKKKKKTQV